MVDLSIFTHQSNIIQNHTFFVKKEMFHLLYFCTCTKPSKLSSSLISTTCPAACPKIPWTLDFLYLHTLWCFFNAECNPSQQHYSCPHLTFKSSTICWASRSFSNFLLVISYLHNGHFLVYAAHFSIHAKQNVCPQTTLTGSSNT